MKIILLFFAIMIALVSCSTGPTEAQKAAVESSCKTLADQHFRLESKIREQNDSLGSEIVKIEGNTDSLSLAVIRTKKRLIQLNNQAISVSYDLTIAESLRLRKAIE